METETHLEDLSTLAADIVALESDAAELAEAKRHIDENISRLKAKIRAELGGPVKGVQAGDLVIDWTAPARTFDSPAFVKAYPPSKNVHMYRLTIDGAAIPPKLLDQLLQLGTLALDTAAIPPKLKSQYMGPGKGDGTVKVK